MNKILLTPEVWCQLTGTEILDPDGWRGIKGLPWTTPITFNDFYDRVQDSTCRHFSNRGDTMKRAIHNFSEAICRA